MARAEILIWDDPFSSVDLILEKKIISELKSLGLLNNKTVILSSHRVTTVRASDYCLFLDKERGLIEEGKTTQLLNPEFEVYEYFKQQMV
jgi:ATP-binding cassette subfamily B protein